MIKKITITAEPLEDGEFMLTIDQESTDGTPPLKAEVIWMLGQAITVVKNNEFTDPHQVNDKN